MTAGRRPGGDQRIPRPESFSLVDAPHWVRDDPQPRSVAQVIAAVRTAALHETVVKPTFAEAKSSAVIAVLADGPRGAEVLLPRRSSHLRNHPGEVSFPGGRMDPGETPEQTALREASEEVDLAAHHVAVRGYLSPLSTFVSRSFIVPIVAELVTPGERPRLQARAGEVARILGVPLAELARTDTYRHERWGVRPADLSIYFFDLDDETIWGATGRMLHQLLELAYG